MKALVLCVAIQFIAQTNAGSIKIGRGIAGLMGLRKFFEKDWIEYDNFCVSQFNEELLSSPMPAGNADIEKCKSICENYNSTDCTAIEWYNNGWNDVNCFLLLDDNPAFKGFNGPRRGDATCHVKADCLSNKDCPWDRPICIGGDGGKCVRNGQSPNSQGCWIKYPSGCPKQKDKSKYKNLQDGRIWNRDTYNGASNSQDKCSARRGPINNWCGVTDVITHYVSEPCQPRDSDDCLIAAWSGHRIWDWTEWTYKPWDFGCKETYEKDPEYCKTWGKDMRRCCPESCKSGKFTKEDCDIFPGDGTCRFPTAATICNDVIRSPCHEKKCGPGCYFPKLDSCPNEVEVDVECVSKGGIECRETCKTNEDCKNFYGGYTICNWKESSDSGMCTKDNSWFWLFSNLSLS